MVTSGHGNHSCNTLPLKFLINKIQLRRQLKPQFNPENLCQPFHLSSVHHTRWRLQIVLIERRKTGKTNLFNLLLNVWFDPTAIESKSTDSAADGDALSTLPLVSEAFYIFDILTKIAAFFTVTHQNLH